MASPAVLDLETLLAPISEDAPTGTDLRGDSSPTSIYFQIKSSRREARAAEDRQLTGSDESKVPDWNVVAQTGFAALTHKTKDLEIVAYTIEAMLRLYGIAGLRDGFRLACGLVERYWDNLYPMPDEDGLTTRVAFFAGLNGDSDREGTLIAPINRLPLTEAVNYPNYTFVQYHDAGLLETAPPAVKERRIAQGTPTLEQIQQSVADTPALFYSTLRDDLQQCLEEFARLTATLDERCGHDSPPSSALRQVLQSHLDVVGQVATDKLKAVETRPADESAAKNDENRPGTPSQEPSSCVGEIRSREDAFRNLEQVAAYFRATEPHTVVSYALEQVVRWGRMPLPELLVELIPEEQVRLSLFRQVGIKPPPTPESSDGY